MLIRRDPIQRILDSRRQEMDELSKMPLQVREKQAESQRRMLEIRTKGQAAVRKQWYRSWDKEG